MACWVVAPLLTVLATSLVDAQDWVIEVVDQGDVGSYVGGYSSLALDAAGYPHISYQAWPDRYLKYARKDETGWHVMTVDSLGFAGSYSSLALDPAGYPHISHWESLNSTLRYTWQDSSGWRHYGVDGGGQYCSLALDASGSPHVSYIGPYWWHLKHAQSDSSGWQAETLDSTLCFATSLALDPRGLPHIAYRVSSPLGSLRYAFLDSLGWHVETMEPGGDDALSLAVDVGGRPHVAYLFEGDLGYAHRDSAGWHVEVVDVGLGYTSWVGYLSLAVDQAGRPSISYYATDVLNYAWRDDTGWQIETVDNEFDSGRYNSLALDGSGRPHISYRYDDGTSGSLRYACRQAQTASGGGDMPPSPRLTLSQVGPNPVRDNLLVTYRLGSWAHVTLTLRNLRGETVSLLDQGPRAAGLHTIPWSPGRACGAGQGLVVLVLEAEDHRVARRLIIAR